MQITKEDLSCAEAVLGDWGGDNRAGVEGTLHRISAIRNRKGAIVGLTCRVGRAVTGHIDMIRDILDGEGGGWDGGEGWRVGRELRRGEDAAVFLGGSQLKRACCSSHTPVPHMPLPALSPPLPPPLPCTVPNSVLFLGRPGVGKTTVIREMARVLSGAVGWVGGQGVNPEAH